MDSLKPNEDFFLIDPDSLIEKWSTFARDYFRKACELADARAEWERSKRKRDVVEAELDRDVRLEPGDFGVATPVREKAVEKAILLDKRYRLADEEVIRAKHSMDIYQAYVDAMDALKKGLEATAFMWQHALNAEPRARGGATSDYVSKSQRDRAFGTSRRNRSEE